MALGMVSRRSGPSVAARCTPGGRSASGGRSSPSPPCGLLPYFGAPSVSLGVRHRAPGPRQAARPRSPDDLRRRACSSSPGSTRASSSIPPLARHAASTGGRSAPPFRQRRLHHDGGSPDVLRSSPGTAPVARAPTRGWSRRPSARVRDRRAVPRRRRRRPSGAPTAGWQVVFPLAAVLVRHGQAALLGAIRAAARQATSRLGRHARRRRRQPPDRRPARLTALSAARSSPADPAARAADDPLALRHRRTHLIERENERLGGRPPQRVRPRGPVPREPRRARHGAGGPRRLHRPPRRGDRRDWPVGSPSGWA